MHRLILEKQVRVQVDGDLPSEQPSNQPSSDSFSCLALLHKLCHQQQALQEQNALLFSELKELQSRAKDGPQINAQINISNPPSPVPHMHVPVPGAGPQATALPAPQPDPAMLLPPPPQAPAVQTQPPVAHQAAPQAESTPDPLMGAGHHVSEAVHAGAPLPHQIRLAEGAGTPAAAQAAPRAPAPPGPRALQGLPRLDLERRDPLVSSTITLEFVSFAPSDALNVPRNLEKLYIRFRFFDFLPTQTPTYVLDKPQQDGGSAMRVSSGTHSNMHNRCTCRSCCTPSWHASVSFLLHDVQNSRHSQL